MKLGYSTWGMPKVPIDTAIRHLAGLGFDGIELTVIPNFTTELSTLDQHERKRIHDLLNEHELELAAIAAHSSLLEDDAEAHARNIWRLCGACDLAVELATGPTLPIVNTTPGGRSDQWDELKHRLAKRTAELAAYARDRGVVIGMEPHVDAIIDTPAKALEFLDLVDASNVKLNFDISHFDIAGIPTEESVAALAPHSAHAHVKDQRGRVPEYEFLIPGEGPFDYVEYLEAMRRHGYDGFITAEVSFMVQRRPNYDALAAADLTYRTLAHAFDVAGISRT
jgi:sugar phosphate isomerase/epimerase